MISLEDFFTTNRAPNDGEQKTLRHLVTEYDEKLRTITNKISDLEAQLQILNDEKRAVLEAAAPFKRALLPFRQLPEDVVREIFIACLPTGRNPTMSNREAPVLLTQISSATRRIALRTPALWAAIHITFSLPSGHEDFTTFTMPARAKGVKEWLLRRSGSLPLHISVYHPGTPDLNDGIGQELIDILLSCCSRWRHVSFSYLPLSLLRISTLTHTDVPVLNSLSICSNHRDRYIIPWNSSPILTAPNLRRLAVSGMSKASDYLANWSNLTHIGFPQTFHSPPHDFVADMASILRQTTCLISCCLSIPQHTRISNPDEISLPFLKVLVVIDSTHSNIVWGILPSIHAPALEAIQYNKDGRIEVAPVNLIALLKRSSSLQELWAGSFEGPHLLNDCLRHCPSLTRLRVSSLSHSYYGEQAFIDNNSLIEAFTLDDDTQRLCPQLEYFHCSKYFALSLGTLQKFITRKNGRNQPLGRWDTLVLKVMYHPADEQLHYIDELASKDVTEKMKLSLLFEQCTPYNSLDRGTRQLRTPEDVWWQCQSKSTLDI
ncbi:hypothetical protein HYPSUDRAFT_37174 [Hypholoma sublateritium FD-334 SS-4]|uniref:F-box domain-containing protein n=1 Tax=Hypholoma sublateritium (strain FD-334 SS-4) TaxID=945553 RepID=A0A0D2P4C1_HYPSF|nr:hypothetical protein HYPSUDRAFT_37174 [Hypholoma sublateritium FD-334 SS-4]